MASKVGFIGLGLMASRIAANLRARGYHRVVVNWGGDAVRSVGHVPSVRLPDRISVVDLPAAAVAGSESGTQP